MSEKYFGENVSVQKYSIIKWKVFAQDHAILPWEYKEEVQVWQGASCPRTDSAIA